MAIAEIDVHALAGRVGEAVVVDVRELDEWRSGHIRDAVHVPLAAVPDRLDVFTGSPTYVVCRSGRRSAAACEFALARGHEVANVVGGMLAWQAAGFDVVTGG